MERRRFIKGSAALLVAGIAAPNQAFSEATNNSSPFDAIIVGAGYSGLTAATILLQAGKKVLVLEVKDRVGGRAFTQQINPDLYLDLGGQWIGPGHTKMYSLVSKYNLKTYPTFDEGKNILEIGGEIKYYKGKIPPLPLSSLVSTDRLFRKLDKLARNVDLAQPWKTKSIADLDKITVSDWAKSVSHNAIALKTFDMAFESIFACSPKQISLFQTLVAIKGSGSLTYMMEVDEGVQKDRIIGGGQLICDHMYNEIKPHIKLNSPVILVEQSVEGVEVKCKDFQVLATKTIISVPLPVAADISFIPPLPAARKALLDNMFMGSAIKCNAVYSSPFWREKGLSGFSTLLDRSLSMTYDNSLYGKNTGILVGFVMANKARELINLTDEVRKKLFWTTL